MVDSNVSKYILEVNNHIREIKEAVIEVTNKINEYRTSIDDCIKRINNLRSTNSSKTQQNNQYKKINEAAWELEENFEMFNNRFANHWNDIHSKFMIISENPLVNVPSVKHEISKLITRINGLIDRSYEIKESLGNFRNGVTFLERIDKTIVPASLALNERIGSTLDLIDDSIQQINYINNKYNEIGQD